MNKQVEFTREALHQMVWERPVAALAREIGVSDAALAKACRSAGIPLPSRGHWTIVRTGRLVSALPLPALEEDQSSVVYFSVLEGLVPNVPHEVAAVPSIQIPTHRTRPHRLVVDLKEAAKGLKEDKGVLPLNYHKVLRVRTSVSQLQRALILMDTLIKQFEVMGYRVRVAEERGETELVLKEGVITFRLDERTKQAAPPPPSRPVGRRGAQHYEPWRPAYILVGTGEFMLEFGKFRLRNCRNTWKDRASASLESQFHEVIAALPSWEAVLLARRVDTEEQEARGREADERRIAVAKADAILSQQRSRLVSNLQAWERAERLRNFVVAAQVQAVQSAEGRAWLDWAKKQVELLDPIRSEWPKLFDLEVKLDRYFTGYSQWNQPEKNWWDERRSV